MKVIYFLPFLLACCSARASPKHYKKSHDARSAEECLEVCPPEGPQPECDENKRAFLVVDDTTECNCKEWACLWISCDQFEFDPENPIDCGDCSKEPVKRDECGCPKWECEPRVCEPEPLCDDCSKLKWDEELHCGCKDYYCDPIYPEEGECSVDAQCLPCQKCENFPWLHLNCSTMFTQNKCVPRECPLMNATECGPCEDRVPREDECGCVRIDCVPKTTTEFCEISCGECEECVFIPHDGCPEAGRHECQRRVCADEPAPECEACQELVIERDSCNCARSQCKWQPDNIQCELDEDCGDDHCHICDLQTSCSNGLHEVKTAECKARYTETPEKPECPHCEEAIYSVGECGVPQWDCKPKACPHGEKPECGHCEIAVPTEGGLDSCGCATDWECVAIGDPIGDPVCETHMDCFTCKWVNTSECGEPEPRNVLTCPFTDVSTEVDNPACWVPLEQDPVCAEYGCFLPRRRRECVENPRAICPEGTEECSSVDGCGCVYHTCCHCDRFDPSSCGECHEPFVIEKEGCTSGTCIAKACPNLVDDFPCEPCHEKVVVDGACGCPEYQCRRKECYPPKPCASGETLVRTIATECGCEINICDKTCEPPLECGEEYCVQKACRECIEPGIERRIAPGSSLP